ncbi:hypothetical protein EGH21_09145 [Halomicroarcula sp. F13]|uniref:DUF7968 domain-containing protein n=1 Tax=Haloarcula rubra TaxID=2487747 RepID=A0AAW4PQC0_9EURY|nr:hypothetical protein [Halomicroarcula rubra]MBX0323193.1 hypothetical protein [Halomicroarcula rubra]
MDDDADVVTLTYRASDSAGVAASLRNETFQQYLRRSKSGTVAVGDEWDEVVNDGCGTTTAVTLTVTAVRGGETVGETTRFSFSPPVVS